jgi:hypothetical protein
LEVKTAFFVHLLNVYLEVGRAEKQDGTETTSLSSAKLTSNNKIM